MAGSILNRLAMRSMKAHSRLYFPFSVTLLIFFAFEFILISIMRNDYIGQQSDYVQTLLGIGLFFATILIVIISIYSSGFLRKHTSQELGLYNVLGLEKKHILYMTGLQLLVVFLGVSLFAIAIGYFAGHLMFNALNRAIMDTGTSPMDYPFDGVAALVTIGILTITILLIFAIWARHILRLNPVNLLTAQKKGDSEPKSRWLLLLLGLLSLGTGYYLALSVETVSRAILTIFIAIFLVILGTYLLFLSLSTIVLKGMKGLRSYYEKPHRFLTVSSMLHRMNNHAVSLATIAILVSGVILVLNLTTTLYQGIESQINALSLTEFSAEYFNEDEAIKQDMIDETLNQVSDIAEIENMSIRKSWVIPADWKEPVLTTEPEGIPVLAIIEPLESYNSYMSEEVDLAEDEVLVTSNFENMADLEEITIAGKTYRARPATPESLPSNYGVEAMYISFHSLEETERVFEAYKPYLPESSQNQHTVKLHFDIVGGPEVEAEVADLMEEITSNPERLGPGYRGITSLTRSHGQKLFYEIYGGLIFIGLIVSFILVAGTLLMLYFRQISQGQEDQEQFAIMKKVGLPDKLIRQTIASQVVWIFAMPLIVAILHNLFASKIAIKLLGIFGSNVTSTYFKSFALVTLVFSLIYLAFYFLTSRSYYQIVNRGQGE